MNEIIECNPISSFIIAMALCYFIIFPPECILEAKPNRVSLRRQGRSLNSEMDSHWVCLFVSFGNSSLYWLPPFIFPISLEGIMHTHASYSSWFYLVCWSIGLWMKCRFFSSLAHLVSFVSFLFASDGLLHQQSWTSVTWGKERKYSWNQQPLVWSFLGLLSIPQVYVGLEGRKKKQYSSNWTILLHP